MARVLVEVRRATQADVPELLLLWAEGRDELAAQGRPTANAEQFAARLGDAMAVGQIDILLARRDDRPAGFLILREAPLTFLGEATALCIDHLFVSAAARRHGVARAMLSHVAGQAERTGAEQVISSVTPWARETHRFFARLGFTPVTVRRSVSPAVLRRRLVGERHRPALEDLLSRRRSRRARPATGVDDPDVRPA